MKLNFTNKKERKNCQNFIKALKQIEKHNIKDSNRPVYMKATSQEIQISSTLSDLHKQRVDNHCLVIIKAEAYTIHFEEQQDEGKVYLINSFKMLRAFKKNQTKISLIQIMSSSQGIKMYFETQGKLLYCTLKVEGEVIEQRWPQQPDSIQQSNYQMVEIATVTESELCNLTMPSEEPQLWLEICEASICFRTVENGKYRKQNKIAMRQANNYFFNRIKAKLKRRVFINVKGQYLLQNLYDTLKKKRKTDILIKNVYHSYVQNQINYSYLITKTQTDFGFLILANSSFTCEEMGSSGQQVIRKQIEKQKETRQSSLLKRQEGNIEEARRIAINRMNEVDEDKRIAEEAYRERRPVGKIQEGEQTFTRKYYSKY